MRILSIDLGIKSVGLAISGVLEIPQPLSSIDREDIFESLKNIIDEYSIELIVVGFPLTLKGEVGKIAKNARAFALQIEKRFKIKTELIDERFTTKEARKIMRKEGIKKDDDRISAMLILERYLESSRTSHLAQKKKLAEPPKMVYIYTMKTERKEVPHMRYYTIIKTMSSKKVEIIHENLFNFIYPL